MNEQTGNALSGEKSPFLRHGAEQPVRWLPWGEAAFERAKREDRPVLLDVGAVWCHWCHVMDRESYEDPETAALINELFIPVKVDRDERPDVDARYQRSVQAMTGQGGWPLTAFLTPEGETFYGGTYFPPDDRYGRPSFRRVLVEVARVWKDERSRALETARQVQARLSAYAAAESEPGALSPGLVETVVEALADAFDFRHGGFGRAPKFPNAGGVDLLLDRYLDRGDDWASRIVVETLNAMARGGIYDQLGGGFHRYATDARWRIPHFEKMAYDNGVLLATVARAHAVFEDPTFRATARRAGEGIVAWNLDVAPALVEAGGFPASQDADVGLDDDGSYWTWSLEEVHSALDGDETLVRTAVLAFGVDDASGAMPEDRSRHVLFRALEPAGLAARLEVDEARAAGLLGEAIRRLKAVRDRRPRPFVDETLYSGWVGLAASGHLAAARYLGLDEAGAAALRALDRVWVDAFDPDRGLARRVGDPAGGGFLEDQAHVAQALVDAFEWTQRPEYLERARRLAQLILERYRDPGGGLRDRALDETAGVAALNEPHRPIVDAPEPSGNAVAALVFLRLAALDGSQDWRREGESVLQAFAGSRAQLGTATATYATAVSWAVLPVTTVAVVGAPGEPGADALLGMALGTYRPRTVVRCFEAGAVDAAALPPELAAMITGEAPRAYVCAGRTCAPPVSEAGELAELLRTFRP